MEDWKDVIKDAADKIQAIYDKSRSKNGKRKYQEKEDGEDEEGEGNVQNEGDELDLTGDQDAQESGDISLDFDGEGDEGAAGDRKKPIKHPDHIHDKYLVCKDSLRYTHLLINGSIPPSRFNDKLSMDEDDGRNRRYSSRMMAKTLVTKIDMLHPDFGINGQKGTRTCAVPLGEKDPMVIVDLPVKSPLYVYTIEIERDKAVGKFEQTYYNLPKWYCKKYSVQKEPLTDDTLDYFANHTAELSQMAEDFTRCFRDTYPEIEKRPMNLTHDMYSIVLEKIGLSKEDQRDFIRPEVIRYIYCDEVNYLSKFYKERVILHMHHDELLALYKTVREHPFELFFYRMSPFTYYMGHDEKEEEKKLNAMAEGDGSDATDAAKEEEEEENEEIRFNRERVKSKTKNGNLGITIYNIFIPELNTAHLPLLPKNVLTHVQLTCVKIYHKVKRSYHKEYNMFDYNADVVGVTGLNVANNPDDEKIYEDAIEWLTHTTVRDMNFQEDFNIWNPTLLKVNGKSKRIYTRESYLHTMSMVQFFEILFKRYVASRYKFNEDDTEKMEELEASTYERRGLFDDLNKELIKPAEFTVTSEMQDRLVPEQIRFLHMSKDCPFVVVIGPGGSGKSEALKRLPQGSGPLKIMVVTAQGRNAAQHKDPYFGMTFTMHNALTIHSKCCTTEAWHYQDEYNADDPRNKRKSPLNSHAYKRYKDELKEKSGIFYKRCPFENVEILVLEEATLMTEEMVSKILSIMAKCSKITKVIVSGGPGQLKPIGSGDFMSAAIKVGQELGTCVEFTSNHRAHGKTIRENCDRILRGEKHLQWNTPDCKHVYYADTNYKNETFAWGHKILEIVKEHKLDPYNHIVVAFRNVEKDNINAVLDAYFRGDVVNDQSCRAGKYVIKVGCKISYGKNDYTRGNQLITNELLVVVRIEDFQPKKEDMKKKNKKGGATKKSKLEDPENLGEEWETVQEPEKVLQVDSTSTRLSFKGAWRRLIVKSIDNSLNPSGQTRYILWNTRNRRRVKKAYASTVHGSQGAEFDTVIVFMPFASDHWKRETVYTAFSRAKKNLIFVGDLHNLASAIVRKEKERNSETGDLIASAAGEIVPGGWRHWQEPSYIQDLQFMYSEAASDLFGDPMDKDARPMLMNPDELNDLWPTIFGFMVSNMPSNVSLLFKFRALSKTLKKIVESEGTWKKIYEIVKSKALRGDEFPDMNRFIRSHADTERPDLAFMVNVLGSNVYRCNHRPCTKHKSCEGKQCFRIRCRSEIITSQSIIQVLKHCTDDDGDSAIKIKLPNWKDDKKLSQKTSHTVAPELPLCPSSNMRTKVLVSFKRATKEDIDSGKWIHSGYTPTAARIEEFSTALLRCYDVSALRKGHPDSLKKKWAAYKEEKKKEAALEEQRQRQKVREQTRNSMFIDLDL